MAAVLPWLGEAAAVLGHTGEAEKALRAALPIVRTRVAEDPSDGRVAAGAGDDPRHPGGPRPPGGAPGGGRTPAGGGHGPGGQPASLRAVRPGAAAAVGTAWRWWPAGSPRCTTGSPRPGSCWRRRWRGSVPSPSHPATGWAALDYGLAVARFADLAGEEKRFATARAVLEESLQVLTATPADPGDAAPALLEAELCWRLAGLAYHADEERELVLRSYRLLQPLARSADPPPRWPVLWRLVSDLVRERGWGEPTRPPG